MPPGYNENYINYPSANYLRNNFVDHGTPNFQTLVFVMGVASYRPRSTRSKRKTLTQRSDSETKRSPVQCLKPEISPDRCQYTMVVDLPFRGHGTSVLILLLSEGECESCFRTSELRLPKQSPAWCESLVLGSFPRREIGLHGARDPFGTLGPEHTKSAVAHSLSTLGHFDCSDT